MADEDDVAVADDGAWNIVIPASVCVVTARNGKWVTLRVEDGNGNPYYQVTVDAAHLSTSA